MGNRRRTRQPCRCAFRAVAPDHHDRLLELEGNAFEPLVELIEMATTWHELEFGLDEPVIGPDAWLDFVQEHTWNDRDRVIDLMIALSSIARPRIIGGIDAESYAPLARRLASVTALRPQQIPASASTA